jgi:ribosomal protein S27E
MAYKKTPESEEILKRLQEEEDKTDFERIRCPLCNWQPTAESRWWCLDADAPEYFYGGCWTSWNTFETRGRCPGCGHQWRWTSCLRCHGWSRHEDWYEKKTDQPS